VLRSANADREARQRERFRRDGKWHDMILMSLLAGELAD
jgi:hypothetical protein